MPLLDNPRFRLTIRDVRLAKLAGRNQRRQLCAKEFEAYLSAMAAMGENSVPAVLVRDLDLCLQRGIPPKPKDTTMSLVSKFVKWK